MCIGIDMIPRHVVSCRLRIQERLEAYIDSQAVERGLKELKGLKPNQKQKFMDAAIASL